MYKNQSLQFFQLNFSNVYSIPLSPGWIDFAKKKGLQIQIPVAKQIVKFGVA